MSYTEASTVYDESFAPRVTLTRNTFGKLTAVIEVEGLDPDRGTNVEERKLGITSLNPPTIEARAFAKRPRTLRLLLDGSWRAVVESMSATPGVAALTPAEISTVCYRVTNAVRQALRAIDEDI
jgi:hypothetical protein